MKSKRLKFEKFGKINCNNLIKIKYYNLKLSNERSKILNPTCKFTENMSNSSDVQSVFTCGFVNSVFCFLEITQDFILEIDVTSGPVLIFEIQIFILFAFRNGAV